MKAIDHTMPAGDAPDLLRHAGLRQTQARKDVLTLLLHAPRPLNHHQLSRSLGSIDKVTLYRVLDDLQGGGIIHRIEAGDRVWRFAVCGCGHSMHCHPHFSCRVCGAIECMSGTPLPSPVGIRRGYVVESREYYLRGLCAACAGKDG